MRSVYAGLGLLGSGTETVEQLGRKLARQAAISEKDGERIARNLQAKSAKAVKSLQQMMESESAKVVSAVRAATHELTKSAPKKQAPKRAKRKSHSSK